MKFKPTDKEGVFKSLFAAYFVLLLHVLLLVGVGVAVVLFKGVYQYLPWILSATAALIIALFWIFYLRIKRSSTEIKDVLSHPAFQNRNVEIKLLGGVATFKLSIPEGNALLASQSNGVNLLGHNPIMNQNRYEGGNNPEKQEAGHTHIEKRLSELAGLYSKNLINAEEYDMAKKRILFESESSSLASEYIENQQQGD